MYLAEDLDPRDDVSGAVPGASMAVTRLKARDLSDDQVGKFIAFHTDGLRMSALPDGTPARSERANASLNTELEFVDMTPFGE